MTPIIRIEWRRFSPRTAFGKEKGSGGRKGTRTFGSSPRASLSASASHKQRLQSPHRGERQRSERALDFPGTVHLPQREPPGLARGLLRRRLCQGRRCVEISILSGPCPHDRALRRGVGLKSHSGRILQLAPTPPARYTRRKARKAN